MFRPMPHTNLRRLCRDQGDEIDSNSNQVARLGVFQVDCDALAFDQM